MLANDVRRGRAPSEVGDADAPGEDDVHALGGLSLAADRLASLVLLEGEEWREGLQGEAGQVAEERHGAESTLDVDGLEIAADLGGYRTALDAVPAAHGCGSYLGEVGEVDGQQLRSVERRNRALSRGCSRDEARLAKRGTNAADRVKGLDLDPVHRRVGGGLVGVAHLW